MGGEGRERRRRLGKGMGGEGIKGRSPSSHSSFLTPHSSHLIRRSSVHSFEGRGGEWEGGEGWRGRHPPSLLTPHY